MRYAGRGGGPPGLAAPLPASVHAALSGACTVSLECVRVGLHKQSLSCNQYEFEPASLLKAVAMLTLVKR